MTTTNTVQTTVIELPKTMRDAMRKRANKGLMVAWINANLTVRMYHDVRKSIVFYDADGLFEYAADTNFPLTDDVLQALFTETAIRYYSRGI